MVRPPLMTMLSGSAVERERAPRGKGRKGRVVVELADEMNRRSERKRRKKSDVEVDDEQH